MSDTLHRWSTVSFLDKMFTKQRIAYDRNPKCVCVCVCLLYSVSWLCHARFLIINYLWPLATHAHQEAETFHKLCERPDGLLWCFLWVLGLPLSALMFLTVPDCRRPSCRKFFWLTFLLSLVWLSLYSFIMVWMITVVGKISFVFLCVCMREHDRISVLTVRTCMLFPMVTNIE